MDKPIVVGSLYNGADLPPYSAGIDSGVNHAGVIAGVHSHGLEGSGYNQWLVDDTVIPPKNNRSQKWNFLVCFNAGDHS